MAGGGENGDGIYPIGEISYPLHPHCLCYISAVTVDPATFNRLMRGYLRSGSSAWPAMGGWTSFVGGSLFVALATTYTANTLANWVYGEQDTLDEQVYQEDFS